jgi:tetratricopeptide (TPR) repeat protein
MSCFGYIVFPVIAAVSMQNAGKPGQVKIEIVDAGADKPSLPVQHADGPGADILNQHYFPALSFYGGGRYKDADEHLTYVIARRDYLAQNPSRAEYMSVSHYLRGMIYIYHAEGLGRYSLAKDDFEAAVKWNRKNYEAYLELARLYSKLGFQPQATRLINYLLGLMPQENILEEARKELDSITKKTPSWNSHTGSQ